MAKIALRAYNHEIESLIEARQIDEAIAHCRHILKTFPKHIQTYRLLGKAFLESQRYGDAADILQRVLSSIPDDFIAHVGMSVIREDEGNLEDAIYHMERAFEVQPANKAIQEELRRLYGRRDGFEPPKVRLSRGALARMYSKGELYPQALAELRAALAEHPERMDLKLLLARNYLRVGQRVEAVDVCNTLLRKLPYCLEANQIMAEVLAKSERAEDALAYRRRVASLDPYEAHVSPLLPNAGRVPDGTVTVERLSYQPGMPLVPGDYQPEWAASLGVHVPEEYPGLDEFPEWLGGEPPRPSGPALVEEDGKTPISFEPFSAEAETAAEPEGEIPDFMRQAGWQPGKDEPGTGEPGDELVFFDEEAEDFLAGSEGLTGTPQAELPDWVREMAPPEETPPSEWVIESAAPEVEAEELAELLGDVEAPAETPEWLEELADEAEVPSYLAQTALLGSTRAQAQAADEAETPEASETEQELPDWLKDLEPQAEGPAEGDAPAGMEEDEIPDWLVEADVEVEPAADEVSTWLAQDGETAEELEQAETPEISEITLGAEIVEVFESVEAQAEAELPEADAATDAELEAEPLPTEEFPAWLQEARSMQPAVESEIETPALEESPDEELPDWLKDAQAVEVPTEGEQKGAEVEPEELAEPAEEIPDWLKGMAAAGVVGAAAAADDWQAEDELPAVEETPVEELPDWLQEARAVEGDVEGELEIVEALPAEEILDWLREAQAAEESAAEVSAEETAVEEALDEAAEHFPEPSLETAAETPAQDWLAALETPVEEGDTRPRQSMRAASIEFETLGDQGEQGEEAELTPAEELPDWLVEMTPASETPSDEALAAQSLAEAALTQRELAEEELVEEELGDLFAEEAQEVESAPPWTTAEALEFEAPAVVEGVDETELAEMTLDVEGDAFAEEETRLASEMPDTGEDMDAAFAWLEGLAAKQGADEALFSAPEERPEAPPDWVTASVEEIAPVAEGATPEDVEEALPPEEIPDWLREVQAEEAGAEEELEAEAGEFETEALPAEEIPDWLQEAQAVEVTAEEELEAAADELETEALPAEEIPDWLQEVQAVEAGAEEELEAEAGEFETEALPAEEIPDWLQEAKTVETAAGEGLEEEVLEGSQLWPDEAETTEQSEAEKAIAAAEEWLEAGEIEMEALPAEEIPDWLQESQAEESVVSEAVEAGIAEASQLWPDEPETSEQSEPEMAIDAAQDWLATFETPVEEGDTKPGRTMLATNLEIEPPVEEAEPTPEKALPDWLRTIAHEPEAAPAEQPGVEAAQPEEELADLVEQPATEAEPASAWEMPEVPSQEAELLEEPEPDEAFAELFAEPVEETAPAPDWMAGEAEAQEIPEIEEQQAEETLADMDTGAAAPVAADALDAVAEDATVAEMPDFGDDMEAAFAWLEGLAAKQGADEALFTAPEERPEAPPEWVTDSVEEITPFAEAAATEEIEPLAEAANPEDLEQVLPAVMSDDASEDELRSESGLEELELGEAPFEGAVTAEAGLPDEPGLGAFELDETPAAAAEELDVTAAWQDVEDFVPFEDEVEKDVEAAPELPAWLQEVEQTRAEAGEAEDWTPPAEAQPREPLDLNRAGLVDLEHLPGIGFTMAQKILAQRDETGPFSSVMDLGQIPGITPDMLQEIEGLVTVTPPAPRITTPHLHVEGPEDLLAARQAFMNGDVSGALEQYGVLIRKRRFLPDILRDLQGAVEANPNEPEFWQALGDAYLRDDQVQPALEAYTRVEELLR